MEEETTINQFRRQVREDIDRYNDDILRLSEKILRLKKLLEDTKEE